MFKIQWVDRTVVKEKGINIEVNPPSIEATANIVTGLLSVGKSNKKIISGKKKKK